MCYEKVTFICEHFKFVDLFVNIIFYCASFPIKMKFYKITQKVPIFGIHKTLAIKLTLARRKKKSAML